MAHTQAHCLVNFFATILFYFPTGSYCLFNPTGLLPLFIYLSSLAGIFQV